MVISINRLRALIDLASADGVETVDIVEEGTHIRISRNGAGPTRNPVTAPTPETSPARVILDPDILASPMFGVLHLTPAPDAKPYVKVGDPISKGQQLCLIEAMKMFNPIYADRNGRLDAILAQAGNEVASGQPLFRISGD